MITTYPELLEYIASCLPVPHVAYGLRPVCKGTAAILSAPKYKAVRLSQSCPAFAFQERWGCNTAYTQLKLSQRQQLLSMVAATGEVQNLECVMAHAPGCWGKPTLVSAARAGHLSVLQRLVAKGATIDAHVLDAAAGRSSGHGLRPEGLEWLQSGAQLQSHVQLTLLATVCLSTLTLLPYFLRRIGPKRLLNSCEPHSDPPLSLYRYALQAGAT